MKGKMNNYNRTGNNRNRNGNNRNGNRNNRTGNGNQGSNNNPGGNVGVSTMESVFTILWITILPLVLLTMILGRTLTACLIAAGVWFYFHRKGKRA